MSDSARSALPKFSLLADFFLPLAIGLASPAELPRMASHAFSRKARHHKALHAASRSGDIEAARALLPLVDPRKPDETGRTFLIHAASSRNAELIELLLPVSDPLAADGEGTTALMVAASVHADECVQLLLPVSDPLATDILGQNAITIAAKADCGSVVEMLAPVSDLSLMVDGAPLLSRALECRAQTVAALVSAIGRDQADLDGVTSLMEAAKLADAEKINLILPIGDARAKDSEGWTALMHLAECAQPDFGDADPSLCGFQALLSASDLSARDRNGRSAFDIAFNLGEGFEDFVPLRLVDALCDGQPQEVLEAVVAFAREQAECVLPREPFRAPRALAALEAMQLRAELASVSPSQAAGPGLRPESAAKAAAARSRRL